VIGCALAATKAKLGFILTLDKNHRIFRLERLPGGACTHWKAPPCHGAHPEPSFTITQRGTLSGGRADDERRRYSALIPMRSEQDKRVA
jgi:hypothetical protein